MGYSRRLLRVKTGLLWFLRERRYPIFLSRGVSGMVRRIGRFLKECVGKVDIVLLACTTVLTVVSLLTIYGAVDNFGMPC